MYPGKDGKPRRRFVGLDNPPVVPPNSPGRFFILREPDLSSLTEGSPVTYRGIDVGVVTAYALAPDGHEVSVTTFIRAPNDRLVHPGTHFWNAGGVAMTLGASGLQLRANSWQQLLAGGVAFSTPAARMATAPSAAGSVFELYDNQQAAMGAPAGPPVLGDTLHNLNDVMQNLNGVLGNINKATAGPQLHDAIASLNRVLKHLDRLTVQTQPNLNELLKSLRATSDAAQRTLALIQDRAGGSQAASTDLPHLMSELSQAARSVRELADYLNRHPDALLRGRKPDSP
jgi:paraquat-inducible protein B